MRQCSFEPSAVNARSQRAYRSKTGSSDGSPSGAGGFSLANDVNNRGSVVGASENAANELRAVLWTKRRGSGHR